MSTLTDAVRVVLWEPQNNINIGTVVRACRNTGFNDLRLIRPASYDAERVTISAPHSDVWLSEHCRLHEEWSAAVEGATRVLAFTARSRRERVPRLTLSTLASDVRAELEKGGQVALVYGREDHGLPNHVVDRADAIVGIEVAEGYRSLNLAQAVVLALHRLFVELGDITVLAPATRTHDLADHAAIERMMGQAETALAAIEFFKGDQRENVLRTIRRIFLKARLDQQELATLWGLFAEIERSARG